MRLAELFPGQSFPAFGWTSGGFPPRNGKILGVRRQYSYSIHINPSRIMFIKFGERSNTLSLDILSKEMYAVLLG
jgi:hypothetical protein